MAKIPSPWFVFIPSPPGLESVKPESVIRIYVRTEFIFKQVVKILSKT